MKKFISVLLCIAILFSAFAVCSYAVEDKGSTQSPVIDGVVDVGEYISERVFDNTDPNTGLPATGNHVNFAAGCIPANGVTVTEYASEDDDNIYIAFVINQDFINAEIPISGRAEAASTMGEHLNVVTFKFNLETVDETKATVSGSAGRDGSSTKSDGTEMRAYRASECDSIAKRNKNGDVFQNITIEIKISKEAIKDSCKVDSVEYIGYWLLCRYMGKDTENRKDVNLCSRPLNVTKANSGFSSFEELVNYYVGADEHANYATNGYKMLRFICFYEEPVVKAWYGPEGTISSAGIERADVLDYTDFGRHAATSTYVCSKKNAAPVVDGVVKPGEYTSSKVYDQANHFTNRGDTSVTVTEYVAHDSEYVYFALVYNTDMSKIQVRMNGQERVRYDLAATEYIYQFIYDFTSAEKVNVSPSRTNFDAYHVFDASEYEGLGKKNKSGGEVVATTVELKLSKNAMRRVFEVSSVDYFGYYGESTTASGNAITNAACFNAVGLGATEWADDTALAAEYGLDTTSYVSKRRIMNIVVLNGETLSESVPVYCDDAHKTCTYEGHEHRAATFDFSNAESLGRLKSNYIPTKIATPPTLNGDIVEGEYTNSRTINNTVEYAAHDDNYVYLGFINPDNGASYFEIFLNAKDNVFTTASASNLYHQIQVTVNGATTEGVNSGGKMVYNTDYWTSMVRTGGKQIVEIQLSKASLRTAFSTDLERGIAYWARYHVNSQWVEVVNPITTYGGCADAAELSAAYGGMAVGGGTRYMNFIMFEEAPETPAIYCPANDVCEHESHASRVFAFDYSNAESLGRLPSMYLATNVTTAPVQNGSIGGTEYTAVKTYSGDDLTGDPGQVAKEYAAQDNDYVYLAFETRKDNWSFNLYLNGYNNIFGKMENDLNPYLQIKLELCAWQGQVASGTGGRTLNIDGENQELWWAWVDNGTTDIIEFKIAKSGIARVFDNPIDRGFGYTARYMANSSWRYITSPIKSYDGFESLDDLASAYGITVDSGTYYMNFVMFEEAPETPATYCLALSDDELSRRADTFDIADMRCLNLLPGHFVPTQLRTPQVTPTVDGVVDTYEYTSSKFYATSNFNTSKTGVTLTEYISHDDDYVYMALVFNTNMSSIDVRMNGKSTVTSDWAQAEYIYYFNATSLGSVDEQKIVGSRGSFATSFEESEYEGIAKKNKNGDTVVSTTFELKLSKEAMKRVFEVSSVDYFGYYANGTAPAGTVTAATKIPNDGLTACGFGTSSQKLADEYGFNRGQYGSKFRLMNFVIFDEDPGMKYYCPAADSCTAAHHAKRSDTFDLTDMRCLYCLPSHYVPNKINADVQTPTPDGVIKAGEYTNKKVYDAAHCSNAPDTGKTVTEYVSQDADWVYIALVYTQNVTEVNFRMNATADMRSVQTPMGTNLQFNFALTTLSGSNITAYVDEARATCSKVSFSRAFTSSEFVGTAKRNKIGTTFKDVTAELKISKEAIKDIFGVDSVDHIAYYAVAGKVVAGVDGNPDTKSGDITNAARMTNAGLTYCGFAAQSSNLEAAYPEFSVDNYASRDGWRLWNFIVFDEEPATYNYYCPEGYTVPEGLTRATELDFADISALGCLPANYVSTVLDNGDKVENDVFTVDVSFGSMSFTYVDEGVGDWNPETHDYIPEPAHWECDEDENKVTVVNESEFAILTSFIYEKGVGFEGITGAFDNAVARLVGTDDEAYAEKSTVNAYLSLDGALAEGTAETEIGQVTIKLTKANS